MNKQQYNVLLTAVIILENRFQSYLNDTPTTVVQGDRGALKEAMRSLVNTFNNIDTPDEVDYDETVKLALESLMSIPEASKTLGDDAITDGKQEFNQDGSRVDGADKEEKIMEQIDADVDIENEQTENEQTEDEQTENEQTEDEFEKSDESLKNTNADVALSDNIDLKPVDPDEVIQ